MASISSAEVFSKAPISVAPLPKSSWAILARSVSSETPVRPLTVLSQSSSRLIFCASSAEKPSFSKASDPFVAACDSLVMFVFMASMLVPLCWQMKSHSWYASEEMPSFWDALSILSPNSAVAFAALKNDVPRAVTDAMDAVTAAASTFAPDLIAPPMLEVNFLPDDWPALAAAGSVSADRSFVIVC